MKNLLITILFLLAKCIQCVAQQSTVSTGGDALGSGGTASFSVGQPIYTTPNGINGSTAQGVQQVYLLSISLPMHFENFTAVCMDKKVNFSWKIVEQSNINYFILEKSTDATQWQSMTTMVVNKNSNTYNYIDTENNYSNNYYRVKVVEFSNEHYFSNTEYVPNCFDGNIISVFPNPTADGIWMQCGDMHNSYYQLYDMLGTFISEKKITSNRQFIPMNTLPNASYQLKIITKNIFTQNYIIIKK